MAKLPKTKAKHREEWFRLVDDLFALDKKVGAVPQTPPPRAGRAKEAGWIAGAIKRPGQLHRDLGIPQGKKIPLGLIRDAAKSKGKVGQRARLALTLRKFR